MLSTLLRLPPVCPSRARVNPGRLCSPTWKRPLNGCLPQSANTLAEAEGGSGAGAALRHGSSAGAGSASCLSLAALLCDAVDTACTHTADRHEGGGLLKSYAFFSLGQRWLCAMVGLLPHSKEYVKRATPAWTTSEGRRLCFFNITHSPSRRFWPRRFSHCSFLKPFYPSPPPLPALTQSVLSAFTQAAQWAAPLWTGVLAVSWAVKSSCDVLTEVASHESWHIVPPLHF